MGDADIDTQALNLQAQRIGECLQSRLAAIVCRVQRSLNRARNRGREQNVATGLDDVRQDGARFATIPASPIAPRSSTPLQHT